MTVVIQQMWCIVFRIILIIMGSVFVFNTPMPKEKLQLVYNFPYFMRVFCLSRNDKNLWLSVIKE